jgi:hypothetical protein
MEPDPDRQRLDAQFASMTACLTDRAWPAASAASWAIEKVHISSSPMF